MQSRTFCSLLLAASLACGAAGLSACGGSSKGYVPVDSPLVEYQPPDEDELVAPDEEPDADAAADDDWGAGMDEDESGDDEGGGEGAGER